MEVFGYKYRNVNELIGLNGCYRGITTNPKGFGENSINY
jgi:hypothetical protein